MANHYHNGRSLAIAAGVAATGGALAILLADPITTGNWRLDHALLPIIVGVTIAAGHLVGSAARARKPLAAIGFAVVFTIGTALTVYSSVGSQTATTGERAMAAEAHNAAIQRAEAAVNAAEKRVAIIDAEVSRLAGTRSTAEIKAALDAVVGMGPGRVPLAVWKRTNACASDQITLPESEVACRPVTTLRIENGRALERDRLAADRAAADAALATARAARGAAGGERIARPKAAAFATAAAVFGFDRAKVEHAATILEPFAYSLLLEMTAIVAFGFAGNHRRETPATVADAHVPRATVADKTEPTPPKPGKRSPVAVHRVATKAAAEADVIQLVGRGQPLPSQEVLSRRWGCHKATASKWLADFERRGIISRQVEGRRKVVSAA